MRKPSVETTANIFVIVVCILVGTVYVKNNFFKSRTAARENIVGKTIKLNGIDAGAAKVTVVLALSSKCRYCDESTGFYQQLTSLRRQSGTGFQTVGVFNESVETAKEYLTKKGLSFDGVISRSLGELGVSGTPTLLMVNGTGKIIYASVGLLDEDKQKEVIEILKAERT